MRHERVLGAYDKHNQETSDPQLYNMIPFSFSSVETTKSTCYGTPVYHFDVVVNDEVYAKVSIKAKPLDQQSLVL